MDNEKCTALQWCVGIMGWKKTLHAGNSLSHTANLKLNFIRCLCGISIKFLKEKRGGVWFIKLSASSLRWSQEGRTAYHWVAVQKLVWFSHKFIFFHWNQNSVSILIIGHTLNSLARASAGRLAVTVQVYFSMTGYLWVLYTGSKAVSSPA